jgi:hypothetical protein
MSKSCCQERRCNWTGDSNEMLTAPNPFDPEDTLTVCPECKTLEHSVWMACDEPGCWRAVTAGTPTTDGYRNTCYDHTPKLEAKP